MVKNKEKRKTTANLTDKHLNAKPFNKYLPTTSKLNTRQVKMEQFLA